LKKKSNHQHALSQDAAEENPADQAHQQMKNREVEASTSMRVSEPKFQRQSRDKGTSDNQTFQDLEPYHDESTGRYTYRLVADGSQVLLIDRDNLSPETVKHQKLELRDLCFAIAKMEWAANLTCSKDLVLDHILEEIINIGSQNLEATIWYYVKKYGINYRTHVIKDGSKQVMKTLLKTGKWPPHTTKRAQRIKIWRKYWFFHLFKSAMEFR
jgi:hypothetical protein